MVKCQNCGNEVADGAKFCAQCGSEIVIEEINANVCPECGSEVAEHMKFCQNCGCELNNDGSGEVKTKFCANCGHELDANLKFCPECGTPTSGVNPPNNTQVVVRYEKSAGLAAVLSFLIIGLGQVYLGLTKKGIILFVLAIVSGVLMLVLVGFILWLLVWGYAIYDAYNSAEKINRGIEVEDTLDFNNLF